FLRIVTHAAWFEVAHESVFPLSAWHTDTLGDGHTGAVGTTIGMTGTGRVIGIALVVVTAPVDRTAAGASGDAKKVAPTAPSRHARKARPAKPDRRKCRRRWMVLTISSRKSLRSSKGEPVLEISGVILAASSTPMTFDPHQAAVDLAPVP